MPSRRDTKPTALTPVTSGPPQPARPSCPVRYRAIPRPHGTDFETITVWAFFLTAIEITQLGCYDILGLVRGPTGPCQLFWPAHRLPSPACYETSVIHDALPQRRQQPSRFWNCAHEWGARARRLREHLLEGFSHMRSTVTTDWHLHSLSMLTCITILDSERRSRHTIEIYTTLISARRSSCIAPDISLTHEVIYYLHIISARRRGDALGSMLDWRSWQGLVRAIVLAAVKHDFLLSSSNCWFAPALMWGSPWPVPLIILPPPSIPGGGHEGGVSRSRWHNARVYPAA